MPHSLLLALLATTLALTACASHPPQPRAPGDQARSSPSRADGQLEFSLSSGTYKCELGQQVRIDREVSGSVNSRIRINWLGSSYRLERDLSYSGLPRFEDRASGLVWIDLPWKGVLLDGRTHRPLASECRSDT